MHRFVFIILLFFCGVTFSIAQDVPVQPSLIKGQWNAQWVTCPGVAAKAYGVYHFRKKMVLTAIPEHFIIHVSADNRYQLFVNGKAVGKGPVSSSLYSWNFDSYDITPYLNRGENVFAALVYNMGEYSRVAQVSNQTGFLLQGDDTSEYVANTGSSWKVWHDTAYTPCALNMGAALNSYFVVGPGDEIHGDAYPWGWELRDFDDSGWKPAKELNTPVVTTGYGTDNQWTLVPRSIPQMEETKQRLAEVRRTDGIGVPPGFLSGKEPLHIPANMHTSILLDQSFETVAYPVIKVSGGKNSKITLTYAESLFDKAGNKGNRNEIEGKTMKGFYDIIHPDGAKERVYSPLWMRCYRYLQLDVETGDEALVIDDFYGVFTGYPLVQRAQFTSNDSSLGEIWKVGGVRRGYVPEKLILIAPIMNNFSMKVIPEYRR